MMLLFPMIVFVAYATSQQCFLCREVVSPLRDELIQYIENSPLTGNELTQSVNNWLQENVCNVMNFTGSQCSNLDTFVDLIVTAYESQGITALELSTDTICEDLGMCAGLSV